MERYRDLELPNLLELLAPNSQWWRDSGLGFEECFVPFFLLGVMFYLMLRFLDWFFTLPPISQEDLERHRKDKKDD